MAIVIESVHQGVCYNCTYSCFCGDWIYTASGGDAGLSYSFSWSNGAFTNARARLVFNAFTILDRCVVYFDGVSAIDTGCVSGTVGATAMIPAGTTEVQVVVFANCAGGSGTVWDVDLRFECT